MNRKIMMLVCTVLTAAAMAGTGYEVSRWTVDSGGDFYSTGNSWEVSGTVGQADAAVMSGNGWTVSGGFWFGVPFADCNQTGTVSLLDYQEANGCLTGPAAPYGGSDCVCVDADVDDDVDMLDVAEFQLGYTGP